MTFVVKKSDLIDGGLLLLIYLQLTILEFWGFGGLLNKVVSLLILLRVFFVPGFRDKKQTVLIGLLAVLFVLSCVFGQSLSLNTAKDNLLMLSYPTIYAYYVCYLCQNRGEFVDAVMDRAFWVVNLTMVLNLIVMLVQIVSPYSIVAKVTSTQIDFYEDTICGLFAYGSTHAVSLFTIFVVLYDLSCLRGLRRSPKRMGLLLYTVGLTGVSLLIAMHNDNKALFLLLPMMLALYWLAGQKQAGRADWISRIVLLAVAGALVGVGAYCLSGKVQELINENVVKLFRLIGDSVSLGNSANGSSERVAILGYALKEGSTWLWGKGFGASFVYQEGFCGFRHFGQADMGSLLLLGGLTFVVVLIVLYTDLLNKIVDSTQPNRLVSLGMVALIVVSILYTQAVTRINCVTCIILIALAYRKRFRVTGRRGTLAGAKAVRPMGGSCRADK